MKKIISIFFLSTLVFSGWQCGQHQQSSTDSTTKIPSLPSTQEKNTAMNEWEATAAGINFRKWEASPAGLKVHTGAAKIRKSIREYTNMEGVVTSLSLPAGSRLGFGMMVRIKEEDYILAFGIEANNAFQQLRNLKVNDKITIKSRAVTKAPKYAYPIIAGHYVERDGKLLFKFIPPQGGC